MDLNMAWRTNTAKTLVICVEARVNHVVCMQFLVKFCLLVCRKELQTARSTLLLLLTLLAHPELQVSTVQGASDMFVRTFTRRVMTHTARVATTATAIATSAVRTSLLQPQQQRRAITFALHSSSRKFAQQQASSVQRYKNGVGVFVQTRGLFIQTQDTPNPLALKFIPGTVVMTGGQTREFMASETDKHKDSKLAAAIFEIEGVNSIFYGADFVSVTIREGYEWPLVKPQVFSVLMSYLGNGQPAMETWGQEAEGETADIDGDPEIVAMIRELIDTRIRPAIQGDGGDIALLGFDDVTGIVKVQLQGSCVGCPSSSITLRNGIETMLMRYIPEVQGIENMETELEEISNDAFRQLEEGLEKVKNR
jgi:Fe-S cluster biogenesis protein NfuA